MGRARGSVTTAQILVRAGISIYHEPRRQGMRHDRCPTTSEQGRQIPQGLRTLCRQPRRNNAEYPVRYRSHGYRNELGLATYRVGYRVERQTQCVTVGIRTRRPSAPVSWLPRSVQRPRQSPGDRRSHRSRPSNNPRRRGRGTVRGTAYRIIPASWVPSVR